MTDLTNTTVDVLILGGGVAGLSAALYAARDGFKTVVVEGDFVSSTQIPGGALLLTPEIENYPGFPGGEGADLVDIIRGQAEKFGAEIILGLAESMNLSSTPHTLHQVALADGQVITTKTVLIVTGAVARMLNVPGEEGLIGKGISTCATCDGFFFKEKKVLVVGGGDTAIEDALFLRRYTTEITVAVRGSELRASGPDAREALALSENDENFNILWNTQVEEVLNNGEQVTGVKYTNGEVQDFDGIFVAIGRDPSTSFTKDYPELTDSEGYIASVQGTARTVFPGVYTAGDVTDKVYRQAITSAGKAVEAALEAREYINRFGS